jgi:GntR family transcriptional regulator
MKGPLKRESIPLYRSLAAIIENKITSGQYDPGSQLPTEDELTRQFNVSKITVRNALMHLELDQLIVRKWGKGTFVAENIPQKKQYIHTNLNEMTKASLSQLGLKSSKSKPAEIPRTSVAFLKFPIRIPSAESEESSPWKAFSTFMKTSCR